MRYVDAWKMEGCVYTIYQSNEGDRFYIFRKEKDGNSNQLRVAFKSADDAKAWVNNVLIPAWQNWHDCNKLAGQAYLDDPDELNEAKNTNKNMKKQAIKLNESQLRQVIKKTLNEYITQSTPQSYDNSTEQPSKQGFYICSMTVYETGGVKTWIGNLGDAQHCAYSSEGTAIGPFKYREEAQRYYTSVEAKRKGLDKFQNIIKENIKKVLRRY